MKGAFGLGDNLAEYSQATGSKNYFDIYGEGAAFTMPKARGMANNASEINFNLRNFSFGTKEGAEGFYHWQKAGSVPGRNTATMEELNMILSNPDLLRKTNFDVFPDIP